MSTALENYYNRIYSPQSALELFFLNTFNYLIDLNAAAILNAFATNTDLNGQGYRADELPRLAEGLNNFRRFNQYWQPNLGTVDVVADQATLLNPEARIETLAMPIKSINIGHPKIKKVLKLDRPNFRDNQIPLPIQHVVTSPIRISNWGRIGNEAIEGQLIQSVSHYVARHRRSLDYILFYQLLAEYKLDADGQAKLDEAINTSNYPSSLSYGTRGIQKNTNIRQGPDGTTEDDF